MSKYNPDCDLCDGTGVSTGYACQMPAHPCPRCTMPRPDPDAAPELPVVGQQDVRRAMFQAFSECVTTESMLPQEIADKLIAAATPPIVQQGELPPLPMAALQELMGDWFSGTQMHAYARAAIAASAGQESEHDEPTHKNHPGHHDGHTCEAMGQMLADFGSQLTTPEQVVAKLATKAAPQPQKGAAYGCGPGCCCTATFQHGDCNADHSTLNFAATPAPAVDAASVRNAALEEAAQAADQQADGTNGPYRTACLQCANAIRALKTTKGADNE